VKTARVLAERAGRTLKQANRWFLGGQDEDLLGVLEVGRLGDVVVLSDDYFAVADEELKNLHSVLTILGGRIVHTGGIKYWA
jgi:predicted amidohydrolase YtcJ